ncbi:FimV/HubP family polar landmark protein, partial [Pseudoalteromonas rubra]|uniref:FimV/HubP family polar landmark protein n=1 Tax=Pseudoalteromonas rubra TaxID=43658 RepID=UPI0012838505
ALADEDFPEFGEEDALSAMDAEPEAEEPAAEQAPEEATLSDAALADEDFPEFDEADALSAMDAEPEAEEPAAEQAPEEATLNDEALADEDFPEFDEEDALSAMDAEPDGEIALEDLEDDLSDLMLSDEDLAGLADSSPQAEEDLQGAELALEPDAFLDELTDLAEDDDDVLEPEINIDEAAIEDEFLAELNETDFSALLDDSAEPDTSEVNLSEDTELDFDALLSEELAQDLEIEDIDEPAKESLSGDEASADDATAGEGDFLEIDDLLSQSEDEPTQEEPYQSPDMDVGLGDFEELLAGENATDVDLEEDGYAAKLDLVRAYIEIGDFDSAENAVEEILSNGPESVQSEAQALKQQIK